MTRILLLSVRFLDDCYHGLIDNGDKGEWPPSPFRVFQALVAGNAHRTTIPASTHNALPCAHRREKQHGAPVTVGDPLFGALRWLESLDAPSIVVSAARAGRVLLTYVLNNISDSNPNSRTPKTIRPTLFNGDRLLQYVWTFEQTTPCAMDHARVIAEAARHIHCLGWGIDLAVGCGELSRRCLPSDPHAFSIDRPTLPQAVGLICVRQL